LLPDGNGDFTRQMGMLVKKDNLGLVCAAGVMSCNVENGEINENVL